MKLVYINMNILSNRYETFHFDVNEYWMSIEKSVEIEKYKH